MNFNNFFLPLSYFQDLADQLDMYYVAPPNLDDLYINSYGFDCRNLNSELPKIAQCFDISDFLKNPSDLCVAKCQHNMLRLKLQRYCDALAHILNTGI